MAMTIGQVASGAGVKDMAMTHKVELVIDKDCPNVDAARERLRNAFATMARPLSGTSGIAKRMVCHRT